MLPQTQIEKTRKELLSKLEELGGKLTAEEDIVFQGTKLILPEKMTLHEAWRFLKEREMAEEQTYSFSRTFMYRPWDGAHATMQAFRRAFGVMGQKAIQTMFGENPPRLVTIDIGPGETIQVPWGAITVPHLPGVTFYTDSTTDPEFGKVFFMHGEGPRKYRHHVEGIFRLIEEELKTNSIYKGKAFDGQKMPKFLDLNGVDPEQVVYSDDTTLHLEANVWSLMRFTKKLVDLGVPMKRAVLLEGPYGTGKTLAAFLTAQVAVANGWTSLMCRPGRDDFFEVMATARMYQPAVVFFEDVDTVADAANDHVSQLLDIFDGIQAKGTQIICVLTTNHVEKIHKGMLRPGRLDALVHVGALDARGIQRLTEVSIPAHLRSEDMDWALVAKSMDGFMPAFVREADNRTILYSVARNKGELVKLETDDFVAAADGLRPQLELMDEAADNVPKDTVSEALSKVVQTTVYDIVDGAGFMSDDTEYYTLKVKDKE